MKTIIYITAFVIFGFISGAWGVQAIANMDSKLNPMSAKKRVIIIIICIVLAFLSADALIHALNSTTT